MQSPDPFSFGFPFNFFRLFFFFLPIYTIHWKGLGTRICGACLLLLLYSVFYLQNHALYWACHYGDVVRAQELLSLGANVNYRNNDAGYVSYSAHIIH